MAAVATATATATTQVLATRHSTRIYTITSNTTMTMVVEEMITETVVMVMMVVQIAAAALSVAMLTQGWTVMAHHTCVLRHVGILESVLARMMLDMVPTVVLWWGLE
jgi:hypothetical protein